MARATHTKQPNPEHAVFGEARIGSAQVPDLEQVRQFMESAIARGALAELVAAVLKFIGTIVAFNAELIARDAQRRRARPPSESLRRLQLEIDFAASPSAPVHEAVDPGANEGDEPDESKSDGKTDDGKKKRGPKNATPHGRASFPSHLPRIPLALEVPPEARICPVCGVECSAVTHKVLGERLTLRPAEFVVEQSVAEVLACKEGCREYMTQAPANECIVPGGALGDELLIEAMVSHFMEATPYERIEE